MCTRRYIDKLCTAQVLRDIHQKLSQQFDNLRAHTAAEEHYTSSLPHVNGAKQFMRFYAVLFPSAILQIQSEAVPFPVKSVLRHLARLPSYQAPLQFHHSL